jgi:AGZA family xanthine/uracil permease-like MFS transporter
LQLIPRAIQAGTAVGIGLITALAGSTEIDLVKPGKYTIVDIGKITDQVVIAMFGVVIIAVGLHYHVKGTFCVVLLFNTFVWWLHTNEWPEGVATEPSFEIASFANAADNRKTGGLLIAELWFLCVLTLSGLVRSMSDLSQLTRDDGTVPRNRWIFIMCGAMTAFSGALCGPPILISPESAGGIKAGAKTGLSTAVCGLLFCLSTFFTPIFKAVPEAATSPLLIAVGVILCQNATKVDWKDGRKAFPAFCCLFFIPFTYNILFGVVLGYTVYVCVGIFTGDLYRDALELKRDLFDDGKIVGVRGHLAMSMDQRDPNITIRLH